jgi:hypothetical protein
MVTEAVAHHGFSHGMSSPTGSHGAGPRGDLGDLVDLVVDKRHLDDASPRRWLTGRTYVTSTAAPARARNSSHMMPGRSPASSNTAELTP